MRKSRRVEFLDTAGDMVAGKYRVERALGQGGMGTVLLATHTLLDCPVALKVLRGDLPERPASVNRLVIEARALARLRGPHIARVLDVEVPDSGPCFLVMEYLDGEDLASVLARLGPPRIPLAVRHVLEACEGLAEAHASGILHRDIKPSNLFLANLPDRTQGIKILDFGLSKLENQDVSPTHSSTILGSPRDMAHEQMRSGRRVDRRCDVWSLGVVLYELLTGRALRSQVSALEIYSMILETPPESPAVVRPDVPSDLDAAVVRCLARDPARRFGSVAELARAIAPQSPRSERILERIASFGPPVGPARPAESVPVNVASEPATRSATVTDAPPGVHRRRHVRVALTFCGAVLAVLGVLMPWIRQPARSAAPEHGSIAPPEGGPGPAPRRPTTRTDVGVARAFAVVAPSTRPTAVPASAAATRRQLAARPGRSKGRGDVVGLAESPAESVAPEIPVAEPPTVPDAGGNAARDPVLRYGHY